MTQKICVAFRFHGNFYHSYRGDTPDELGFGKDIRIIRHLLTTLNDLNARGIPVRGTWDFENHFSLGNIMPLHCPDIIAGLQQRVREGRDEMQLMSYNNGLISAHTAREYEESIRRGITNKKGSGLSDLFEGCIPDMVRPQEMMFTPIHLKLYPACGIHSISLFYSALPFNGFSNFIPPLSFAERYNPLTLAYPGIEASMTLMPCYNTGDLLDHLTLRRWVKAMRRQQLAMENPTDLLLLIDMDADDDFWVGFEVPVLKRYYSTIQGLKGLVESIADLDYVVFTTPGVYLYDHAPLRTIHIGQDTADGSFDGLASWAEKWSNQRLWTGLERARILDLQTRHLLVNGIPTSIESLLDESFETRIKILSTTHFGMSAPVMNLTRERIARDLVQQAVEKAAAAFAQVASFSAPGTFSLLDYPRGDSTSLVRYPARPSRAVVRLPLQPRATEHIRVQDASGRVIPSAVITTNLQRELFFVERFAPGESKEYSLQFQEPVVPVNSPVDITDTLLRNDSVQLRFDPGGQVISLQMDGVESAAGPFLSSGVTYAGKTYRVRTWNILKTHAAGLIGMICMTGSLTLPGKYEVKFEREIMLATGMPYVYVSLRVHYPRTPDRGYHKAKARRLERLYDDAWQEVMPCEINPSLTGSPGNPLRIWKHNYCDHISTYRLDYGNFSRNEVLDSINNHVTHAWVAVSDGTQGLLVAQTAEVASGMAFCPLRTRRQEKNLCIQLNPFGTYSGRQYHYATADTGVGNFLATHMSASDHIKPYAPSYNGQFQEFRLLIAPYHGDEPPETVREDAEAFAYPYLVLNDDAFIAPPAHRSWDGTGLG